MSSSDQVDLAQIAGSRTQVDLKTLIAELHTEAKRVRDEYDAAFETHKSNSAVSRILGALGVEAAYEYFEIPRSATSAAVSAFLRTWETTPEYRRSRDQFEALFSRVKALFGAISQRTPSLRPPGNSQQLIALLKPVVEAKRLDTRIARLMTALEKVETRPVVYSDQIPSHRPRARRSQGKRFGTASARPEEALAWTLMGTYITISLALTFGLAPAYGWEVAVTVSLAAGAIVVLGLVLTRRWWVSAIVRRLAHQR